MRTRLPSSLVTACILALASAPVSAQTTAEARKSYDLAIQGAKRDFLKCDADALAAGVAEDYTGVTAPGHVTKGRAGELKGDREFCAANTVTAWDATTTDFQSNGPVAWAAGILRMTYKVKATGKVEHYAGHFLAAYDHKPGGKWFQRYFMMVPVAAEKK